MKKMILGSVFSVLALAALAQPAPSVPPSADEVIKQACKLAGEENKNVFIIFTASWCGWCKKMDKSMQDPVCTDFFSGSYIIRHLVVNEPKDKMTLENPGAKEVLVKYHGEGQGIPFWLVFDKNGNLLADSKIRDSGAGPDKGENTGCPATAKEVDYFISVLQKTSGITASQVEMIRKRFRENEN